MITVYSKNVTVPSGSAVPFNIVKTDKGDTAKYKGNSLLLQACGVYTIMFDASLTSQTVGDVTVALVVDGVALPETEMTVNIATAGAAETVSFVTDVTRANSYCSQVMCSTQSNVQVIATHSVDGSTVEFQTALLKEFRVIGR